MLFISSQVFDEKWLAVFGEVVKAAGVEEEGAWQGPMEKWDSLWWSFTG